eukprot:Gb_27770 [translate_table: standard]
MRKPPPWDTPAECRRAGKLLGFMESISSYRADISRVKCFAPMLSVLFLEGFWLRCDECLNSFQMDITVCETSCYTQESLLKNPSLPCNSGQAPVFNVVRPHGTNFNLHDMVSEHTSFHNGFSGIVIGNEENSSRDVWDSGNKPLACEHDLKGMGSLNTTCQLNTSLVLASNIEITGEGNLEILSHVSVNCPILGCLISINISGDLKLAQFASFIAGTLIVDARNVSMEEGSSLNTTGLGGEPPSQSSGTPLGTDGAGGGHGGRGASCVKGDDKDQEDTWGGDVYTWSNLSEPWSYGSKGGTTSIEKDFGGGGGGRIKILAISMLSVNGTISAEGGDGGTKGGGGSGGSIILHTPKL